MLRTASKLECLGQGLGEGCRCYKAAVNCSRMNAQAHAYTRGTNALDHRDSRGLLESGILGIAASLDSGGSWRLREVWARTLLL